MCGVHHHHHARGREQYQRRKFGAFERMLARKLMKHDQGHPCHHRDQQVEHQRHAIGDPHVGQDGLASVGAGQGQRTGNDHQRSDSHTEPRGSPTRPGAQEHPKQQDHTSRPTGQDEGQKRQPRRGVHRFPPRTAESAGPSKNPARPAARNMCGSASGARSDSPSRIR